MYYRVLVASQKYHGKESLTYSSANNLDVGQLVAVPLQNQRVVGIIESKVSKPSFTTKGILSDWPIYIPRNSLALLQWLHAYYPAPLGLITELFTPPAMTKKLPEAPELPPIGELTGLPPLTTEQKDVLDKIADSAGQNILLHGDTGTGKTRIYLELTRQSLADNKSVIILTPEIGLTGPLLDTFKKTFGPRVLVTHSEMTPGQRREVWFTANTSTEGIVIIGPRSALFSTLQNIGLIVMDEAHDSAYKQEQSPHYQTSRVAAQLARLHGARLVMGSATPLVADYFAFESKKLPILRMVTPAIQIKQETSTQVVDLRNKENFSKSPWLSNSLLSAIKDALEKGEQSLLFLNRRGSARLILCDKCGWQALCPHCDIPLTYHHDQHLMRCHSCDFRGKVPMQCPTCANSDLIFRSIGTKALESEVTRLFPGARVNRFDRDTEKSQRLLQQYEALHSGDIDILIGTQSIVKGFDLPKLSIVGIIQADGGLQIPDFTATERTFQLLSQVSGRIGRGHRRGSLFVQTYDPESTLISLALAKDYSGFYEQEIKQRELYNFPPHTFLLKVSCARASSKSAMSACQKLADELKASGGRIVIEGPAPRFIEKMAGKYVWHLIIKSGNRSKLVEIAQSLKGNYMHDLDPSDLL